MFIQNQILGMKWISTLVGMGLDKLGQYIDLKFKYKK